jgi:hypothetical protein
MFFFWFVVGALLGYGAGRSFSMKLPPETGYRPTFSVDNPNRPKIDPRADYVIPFLYGPPDRRPRK